MEQNQQNQLRETVTDASDEAENTYFQKPATNQTFDLKPLNKGVKLHHHLHHPSDRLSSI